MGKTKIKKSSMNLLKMMNLSRLKFLIYNN